MVEIERDACKLFNTNVRFLKQIWIKQYPGGLTTDWYKKDLQLLDKTIFDLENPRIYTWPEYGGRNL